MVVCKDDIVDKHDMDEHKLLTDHNIDSFDEENSQAVDDIDRSAGVVPQAVVDNDYNDNTPPYHELLLRHFNNNYKLIAQKQSGLEGGLQIRALILKNKIVVYNYSFTIIGTDNVPNATITAAIVMCNLYIDIAAKGDTLTCSLGAGNKGVLISKTRNLHISKFITIFEQNQKQNLTIKLMNMSRENLCKSIQFLSSHGRWKKTTNYSQS